MRWWLVVAGLWLLVVLTVPDAQAKTRPRNHDGETRRGKRRKDGRGHPQTRVGRSRPLKIRLVPGPIIPLEPAEYRGKSLFLKPYKNIHEQHASYNVIPGKQGQCVYEGLTMFDQAVWSPMPCVTCLCTGGRVVCDELACPVTNCLFPFTPAGECCPVCTEPDSNFSLDLSGDSPVPHDPTDPVTPLIQEEIRQIIWREAQEHHEEEEERVRKKEEARRKRRRQRKEQEERQRKLVEERRREEEEVLRLQIEREEEEWRRQIEEEEKRRQEERRRQGEEDRRQKEASEREVREMERKLKEDRRRQEEMLREELLDLIEKEKKHQEEEEEEEVWLRGDVFQMPPKEPQEQEEPEEPDLLPAPIPRPPVETEEEEETEEMEAGGRRGLPPGCDISDVIVTCENAKLTHFPPLAIPELKSLSLEGNNISSIPAEAFNGIPNLEWINLKKNKLNSAGIDTKAFKVLKNLRRLYLDGNLLETVPSDLPPTLQELKINENRLRGIDENSLQDLSSLMILELEGNLLSEGNMDPLAFAPLTQLSYLRLGRNHFRTVPQGLPKSLLELYLENNLIEEISETVFNQTSNLNIVSLRHNKLDESRIAPLAWINHRNLESIDLSHNDFYLVPSYLPKSLIHLVLVGNNIERVPGVSLMKASVTRTTAATPL
ncbi:extracellular matrix protein 2 isoform 3-T3 [Pholidichthys leucotaenia]